MNKSVLSQSEHYVRSLLEKLSDRRLHYHNLSHTLNVVQFAKELAVAEHLSAEETETLLIAEWFHDTGFTVSYVGHERESALIASRFLSPLLPQHQITEICNCILATTKGTTPEGRLQSIMHDADYGHFFEPGYFSLIENLRKEVAEIFGRTFTHQQWYELNTKFISVQTFYTPSYQQRWSVHKEILLAENNRMLKEGI